MKSLLMFLISLKVFSTTFGDSYWTRVYVEASKLNENEELKTTEVETNRVTNVGFRQLRCEKRIWCQIVCYESDGSYLMTSLLVSPGYKNTSEGMLCYTRIRPDLLNGAKTSSSGVAPDYPQRVSDNAIKRMNTGGRDHDECFHGEQGDPIWILVELLNEYEVESVTLYPQTYEPGATNVADHYTFRNLKVKVGNSKQSGDFSSYTLLGTYEGPNTSNEPITIKSTTSIKGKYISVEKPHIKTWEALMICFMQVCKTNSCN